MTGVGLSDTGFIFIRRCFFINSKDIQKNEEIRDPEVRLIDEEGSQMGIFSAKDATWRCDVPLATTI